MNFQLSVPAKTFILGEYLVLKGGPALVLTSQPSFMLNASEIIQRTRDLYADIHPDSPAGKFISRHVTFYDNFNLNFIDPYQEIGGLGASSAQFALFYALKMQLQHLNNQSLLNALHFYLEVAWNGQGIAPSGADVIAQLTGGICFFHPEEKVIEQFDWPFRFLDYCLIHTNNKIATHNHLKELYEIDITGLANIVEDAQMSIEKKDGELFAGSINRYRKNLQQKHLVLEETQLILHQIDRQQGVVAAKGCGALGADVIFVLLETKSKESFVAWCAKKHLRIIYLGQELGKGLKWLSF